MNNLRSQANSLQPLSTLCTSISIIIQKQILKSFLYFTNIQGQYAEQLHHKINTFGVKLNEEILNLLNNEMVVLMNSSQNGQIGLEMEGRKLSLEELSEIYVLQSSIYTSIHNISSNHNNLCILRCIQNFISALNCPTTPSQHQEEAHQQCIHTQQENKIISIQDIRFQNVLNVEINKQFEEDMIIKDQKQLKMIKDKDEEQSIKQKKGSIDITQASFRKYSLGEQECNKLYQDIIYLIQRQYLLQPYHPPPNIKILFNLSRTQIRDQINTIDYKDYYKVKMQTQEYIDLLEKRMSNKNIMDKYCAKHEGQVRYRRLRDNIYICNRCISQIGYNNQQIICIKHQQPIIYFNQTNDQTIKQPQYYLCSKCEHDNKYTHLICNFHYCPITHLCIEQSCIKNDLFKVCRSCNTHQHHEIVRFQQQQLVAYFEIKAHQIQPFEQYFLDIRQRLKLNPIKKLIDNYIQQSWTNIRFIQAFAINNHHQIKLWIDTLIAQGKKQDMYVLWSVNCLNKLEYTSIQKSQFLQVFADEFQKKSKKLFERLGEQVKNFRINISRQIKLDRQLVEIRLKQKYKQISNIQTKHKCIYQKDLYHLKPWNYQRVQRIQICKQRQEEQQQKIYKNWKNWRILFFKNEIPQAFRNININNQIKQQIINQILNQKEMNINLINKFIDYKQIIIKLLSKLKNRQKYYTHKLNQCFPLLFILQPTSNQIKFINLRQIKIHYKSDRNGLNIYRLSAFELFRIIYYNENIESIDISGVQIFDLQQLMKYVRVIKCELPHTFRHQDHKILGYYQSNLNNYLQNNKNTIVYQLNTQYQSCATWIKLFEPNHPIRLSISAKLMYYLHSINSYIFQDHRTILQYFSQYFNLISDVTVQIYLTKFQKNKEWIKNIKNIINTIKIIKRMKLSIIGDLREILNVQSNINIISVLLKQLCKFKDIISISFLGLEFNQYLPDQEYQKMEMYLQQLFKNNSISSLTLYSCERMFRLPPNIRNLTQIKLDGGIYLFGGQYYWKQWSPMTEFINNNPHLKIISNRCVKQDLNNKINLKNLKNLQTVYLGKKSVIVEGNNWVNDTSLQDLICQNIQNFTLKNIKGQYTEYNHLQSVFAKMTNLEYLCLENINFEGSILQSISSINLRQIQILGNEKIINQDIQLVDRKWPYLRKLSIRGCPKVNHEIFYYCNFKGLLKIRIPSYVLHKNQKLFKNLKMRGLQIIQC